jgi:hypothetical protein
MKLNNKKYNIMKGLSKFYTKILVAEHLLSMPKDEKHKQHVINYYQSQIKTYKLWKIKQQEQL